MIEFLPESHDNVIIAKAIGKITVVDYETLIIPKLDRLIAEHARVCALVQMGTDFKGWELKAMWIDIKYAIRNRKSFAKLAVVDAPKWVEIIGRWGNRFLLVDAKFKAFPEHDLQAAIDWLNTN